MTLQQSNQLVTLFLSSLEVDEHRVVTKAMQTGDFITAGVEEGWGEDQVVDKYLELQDDFFSAERVAYYHVEEVAHG